MYLSVLVCAGRLTSHAEREKRLDGDLDEKRQKESEKCRVFDVNQKFPYSAVNCAHNCLMKERTQREEEKHPKYIE